MTINLFKPIAQRAARVIARVPFVRTLVVLAIPTLIASCSQINSSPDTTTPASAAVILSADSVEYPNACRLDSATLRAALNLTDEQVARIVFVQDSLRAA